MSELLRLLHVLGWSSWFGLAIAEASLGVQVRKAGSGARAPLARVWARVGTIELGAMAVAILFGLALFGDELATSPFGPDGFMKQRAFLFIHIMLALGIVAAVFALLAGKSRGDAVNALGTDADFMRHYKRASILSGIATLLILATMAEVYLR